MDPEWGTPTKVDFEGKATWGIKEEALRAAQETNRKMVEMVQHMIEVLPEERLPEGMHEQLVKLIDMGNDYSNMERKRRERKQQLFRQWRGIARSIGPLLALQRRAAERTYAIGGIGYEEAAASFAQHAA